MPVNIAVSATTGRLKYAISNSARQEHAASRTAGAAGATARRREQRQLRRRRGTAPITPRPMAARLSRIVFTPADRPDETAGPSEVSISYPLVPGLGGHVIRRSARGRAAPASRPGRMRGLIGHVECGEVHGDTPYQRDRAPSKNAGPRSERERCQPSAYPIAAGRDPARPLRGPGRVVADGLAGPDFADRQHPGTQPDRRRIGFGRAGGRIDAVERGARTREVGAERRPQEDAGRIGKAARAPAAALRRPHRSVCAAPRSADRPAPPSDTRCVIT